MGNIKDNDYLSLHRQYDFHEPELIMRHHRGDQGIDFETRLPMFIDGKRLAVAALSTVEHFETIMRALAPEFSDRLPPKSFRTYWHLFRDAVSFSPDPVDPDARD